MTFILLLTGVLAGQSLAHGADTKFNSNADDVMKIRSLLEEFRQDIIHADAYAYALTKLMLNPDVLFHVVNNQEQVDRARKYNAQFDGLARAPWMDLRNSWLHRRTSSKNLFRI